MCSQRCYGMLYASTGSGGWRQPQCVFSLKGKEKEKKNPFALTLEVHLRERHANVSNLEHPEVDGYFPVLWNAGVYRTFQMDLWWFVYFKMGFLGLLWSHNPKIQHQKPLFKSVMMPQRLHFIYMGKEELKIFLYSCMRNYLYFKQQLPHAFRYGCLLCAVMSPLIYKVQHYINPSRRRARHRQPAPAASSAALRTWASSALQVLLHQLVLTPSGDLAC